MGGQVKFGKDNNRVVLRKGEGQRENGSYYFRWSDKKGNRHYIYAKTLEDLREQEKAITKEKLEGLKAEARYKSVNDLFDLWIQLKRGVKNNTFQNYKYMYNTFVRPVLGKKRVSNIKKSDIKTFYNYLADQKRYKRVIKKADLVKYISPEYSSSCFQIRNEYMILC